MEILFLDAAANLGFAYGPPGQCPVSGSVEVWDKIQPIEIACGRAARWLVAQIKRRRPDLIGIEHPQSSGALQGRSDGHGGFVRGRGNAKSTDSQLMINGAMHGVCGVYGIPVVSPYPSQIRKMVCGRSYAPEGQDTKKWVAGNLVLIHMLPGEFGKDYDRSDAVAGFVFVSAVHGKSAPPLVLRG